MDKTNRSRSTLQNKVLHYTMWTLKKHIRPTYKMKWFRWEACNVCIASSPHAPHNRNATCTQETTESCLPWLWLWLRRQLVADSGTLLSLARLFVARQFKFSRKLPKLRALRRTNGRCSTQFLCFTMKTADIDAVSRRALSNVSSDLQAIE